MVWLLGLFPLCFVVLLLPIRGALDGLSATEVAYLRRRGWPAVRAAVAHLYGEGLLEVRGSARLTRSAAAMRASHRLQVVAQWDRHTQAGRLLADAGVTGAELASRIEPGAGTEPVVGGRRWRTRKSGPTYGRSVAEIDQAAHWIAARAGHRWVGTSHILLALLTHRSGYPAAVLRDLGVDVDRLVAETRRWCGNRRIG